MNNTLIEMLLHQAQQLKKHYSYNQLVEKSGLNKATIWRVCEKAGTPSISTLAALEKCGLIGLDFVNLDVPQKTN